MDEVCNEDGKGMIRWMDKTGMHVLNTTQGNAVIDYIAVNEKSREDIEKMKIGKRIDSDHLPLEVSLYKEGNNKKDKEEEEEYEDWSKEGEEKFRRNLREENIQESWEGMIGAIKKAICKKKRGKQNKRRKNRWWNGECREKRREGQRKLLEELKDHRNVRVAKEYYDMKKDYKALIKKEKEEEEERQLQNLVKDRSESGFWKAVRSENKKWRVSSEMKEEDWEEHFKEQYDGEDLEEEEEDEVQSEKFQQPEISKEEIIRAVRKLKRKKAPGQKRIRNEAWKEGLGVLIGSLHKCINKVWKKGKIPKSWREG